MNALLMNPFLDTSPQPEEPAPDTVRSSPSPALLEEVSGVHEVPEPPSLWGRRPNAALAIAIVSRASGVSVEEIRSRDRHASIAMARHVVMWLLHAEGFSYPEIGRALDRDHTTVLSAFRRVERERAKISRCRAWTDCVRERYREEAEPGHSLSVQFATCRGSATE